MMKCDEMERLMKDTMLYQFLGADGMDELKHEIIKVIAESVRDQIEESKYYIISPDDISNDLYEGIIEELKEEVRDEYKAAIKEELKKKLGAIEL